MSNSKVTVAVVPRERFSYTSQVIDSVYENTEVPFDLICVDGGSPKSVKEVLEEQSKKYGFRLIRTEHVLSPNEARNIAIRAIDSTYVVFLDNDAFPSPGWLKHLLKAAESRGEAIVGPTYLIGSPTSTLVHMAGGKAHIKEEGGERVFHEEHYFMDQPLEEVSDRLKSGPTELAEFHCMLVKRDLFDKVGMLDENLLSVFDHVDLCLRAREAGLGVYYEKDSLVTYVTSPPWTQEDQAFFLLRWSKDWNEKSTKRFQENWSLSPNDPTLKMGLRFGEVMQERMMGRVLWPAGRASMILKYKLSTALGSMAAEQLQNIMTKELRNKRSAKVPSPSLPRE